MKILKEDFEDFEEEGLLAQLVERGTGIAEVMGSNQTVVFLAARIS